ATAGGVGVAATVRWIERLVDTDSSGLLARLRGGIDARRQPVPEANFIDQRVHRAHQDQQRILVGNPAVGDLLVRIADGDLPSRRDARDGGEEGVVHLRLRTHAAAHARRYRHYRDRLILEDGFVTGARYPIDRVLQDAGHAM